MLKHAKSIVLGAVLIGGLAHAAHATDYPNRTIKVIVPFAAGGGNDAVGRVVAEKLAERLGQPVIIENRVGAGGNIGAEAVAKATPDGYTLLAGAFVAHAINMTLQKSVIRYDLDKDFAPISLAGVVPLTLVVHPSLPVKTAQEFIAYVKANPGEVTYASAGAGSTQHLAAEMFKLMTKTQMRHVPYKGSAPAVNDLLGGHVNATFETGPVVLSQAQAGLLRPLMVANRQRLPELPDVPTAAEVGLPGFEVATQYGFLAPAGTPQPIVDRLSKEIAEILRLPAVQAKLLQQGALPVSSPPEQTRTLLREEVAKWAKVIQEGAIQAQ
jgi:tripartite-type tricarboxylate transporter receptor subunit TctC